MVQTKELLKLAPYLPDRTSVEETLGFVIQNPGLTLLKDVAMINRTNRHLTRLMMNLLDEIDEKVVSDKSDYGYGMIRTFGFFWRFAENNGITIPVLVFGQGNAALRKPGDRDDIFGGTIDQKYEEFLSFDTPVVEGVKQLAEHFQYSKPVFSAGARDCVVALVNS